MARNIQAERSLTTTPLTFRPQAQDSTPRAIRQETTLVVLELGRSILLSGVNFRFMSGYTCSSEPRLSIFSIGRTLIPSRATGVAALAPLRAFLISTALVSLLAPVVMGI